MYESLTVFIDQLDSDDYGTWYVDKENDGSAEHPIQFPFVIYGRVVQELEEAVNLFAIERREMMLTGYGNILEANGISWNTQSMTNADVSVLDGQAVMALLVGAVRAERFCDGALLEFLENGSIKRWLERLRELEPDEYSK